MSLTVYYPSLDDPARQARPQGEGFRSAGGENLQRTARLLELQEAKRSFAENFFAYFLF